MTRSQRSRAWSELLIVSAMELTMFVVLLRSGRALGTIRWEHLQAWLSHVGPQSAFTSAARVLGLAVSGWLLGTTVLYATALLTRRHGLSKISRRLVVPTVRKLIDTLAAATVAASSMAAFTGVASASTHPQPGAGAGAPAVPPASPMSRRDVAAPITPSTSTGPAYLGRHLPHPGALTHAHSYVTTSSPEPPLRAASPENGFAGLAPGTKVIVVQPGDCLSVLAERHLGDWRLDEDIAQLNRGRLQPDGRRLEDDHWIYPGWVLVLPPTAVGAITVGPQPHQHPGDKAVRPGRRTSQSLDPHHRVQPAPVVSTTTSEPPATTTVGPTSVPAAPTTVARSGDRPRTIARPVETHRPAPSDDITVPAAVTVGALVAGGVIWKLTRQRHEAAHARPRRYVPEKTRPEVQGAERRARVISSSEMTAWVDAAVRYLSGLVEEQALTGASSVASLAFLTVGPDGLTITLSNQVTEAVGWFSPEPGRSSLRLDSEISLKELEALAADRWPAWPALVSFGTNEHGASLLVNLEYLGSCAVDGPAPHVSSLLSSLALQLVSQPWTEEMLAGVHVVGDTFVTAPGLKYACDPDSAMALAETLDGISSNHQELTAALPVSALRAVASEALPHVVIAFPQASRAAVTCLAEASVPQTSAVASVLAGPCEAAPWQLVIDASGSARLHRTGKEDDEAIVLKLDPAGEDMVLLGEALGAASRTTAPPERPRDSALLAGLTVDIRSALAEPSEGGRMGTALAAAQTGPTVAARGTVEICLLGPVELIGGDLGSVEPSRQKAALSLISYLATHERLVSADEIATALWPLDASKESGTGPQRKTVTNVISRARALLGYGRGGSERIVYNLGGYRLADDVTCDWSRFQSLVRAARRAPADEAIPSFREALGLVRGEPLAGAIASQFFEWVASEHLDFTIAAHVVDAAQDLGELALGIGDYNTVIWAVEKGLQLEPTREELFRLWMHAFGRTGRPAKVDDVYRRLKLLLRQRIHPLQEPQPESREVWLKYTTVELSTNFFD